MKHILVAIDGSEVSYRALEHGAKLTIGLAGRMSVLIVRQVIVGRHDTMEVWSDGEVRKIIDRSKVLVARLGGDEPAIIEEFARDVAFTIVEVALKVKADMIVMGASGIGAVKAFVLGSVSKEVLRKATVPVTIVH